MVVEHALEPLGGLRWTAVVALPLRAFEPRHEFQLLRRFNPLRHDLEADGACERDDRADNRLVRAAHAQVPDEAAVNFQLVDREPPQVAQARIARTEVIDCDTDPHLAELFQYSRLLLRIGHERALGQFDLESVAMKACLGQRRTDGLEDALMAKLRG